MAVGKERLPATERIPVTTGDRSIIAIHLDKTAGITPGGAAIDAVLQDAAIIIGAIEEVGMREVQICVRG